MGARTITRLAATGCLLIAAMSACRSDKSLGPDGADPISNPTGLLSVGDLLMINVNGNDPCDNAVYHPARVVAVGSHSIIFADTLNPKNGFVTTDYLRFAARFDSLVYPLDVANFGEPTDIDKNGRIAVVFTRAVNELTPFHAASYVGGFTFSRDLFPSAAPNSRAQACKGSNQGEYFYALAADPSGTINGNLRSVAFVDSSTTAVLAHELQHLINASRRLYVVKSPNFEEKWLDEGLAHIAEELLYYRESGLSSRLNLDINTARATAATRLAFSSDMSGNANRYKTFLQAPSTNSPYAPGDSLPTRGAAWSLLRYAIDRANAADGFASGNGLVVSGTGDIQLPASAVAAEYVAVVVNTSSAGGVSANFTIRASGINSTAIPSSAVIPLTGTPDEPLHRDVAFEARLRSSERSILTPMMESARAWFSTTGRAQSSSTRALTSMTGTVETDASTLLRLVSSQTTGLTNFAGVFGDASGIVRDWSISNAVDDVAAPATQYQQRSWNFHSIYPGLTNPASPYPLTVVTPVSGVTITGTITAGGSAYYRMPVNANASATVTLGAVGGAASQSMQLVIVRTK